MQKRALDLNEIEKLVEATKYPVDSKNWFISRCVDGRYTRQESKKAPLAKPGADTGDLMMVLAASKQYNLNIKPENALEALMKTIGDIKNLRFHTDTHVPPVSQFLGCGHFKLALQKPEDYALDKADVNFIAEQLPTLQNKGATCVVLDGDHQEGAVVVVFGENWSIAPFYTLSNGSIDEVFVYQKTLDNKRRHLLVKNLLPYIKTDFEVFEEYLYHVLSEVSDNQLLETVARLAQGLPMYTVTFKTDGTFIIEEK